MNVHGFVNLLEAIFELFGSYIHVYIYHTPSGKNQIVMKTNRRMGDSW